MGIIKNIKHMVNELEAEEIERESYQKKKLEKLNSLSNQIIIKNDSNRMDKDELEAFLQNNEITIPEGAFINKEGNIEYEILERCIYPPKIICPDCGGITLEGLDFCDKCGGEINIF
ncbi:MAG: hypothetical protein IJD02_01680 [Lachnospiraceae bacterium]|nr:hypothetical protein [Lachnospiraceae bacterium]